MISKNLGLDICIVYYILVYIPADTCMFFLCLIGILGLLKLECVVRVTLETFCPSLLSSRLGLGSPSSLWWTSCQLEEWLSYFKRGCCWFHWHVRIYKYSYIHSTKVQVGGLVFGLGKILRSPPDLSLTFLAVPNMLVSGSLQSLTPNPYIDDASRWR